jgi:Flp pilus assembly protein TadG
MQNRYPAMRKIPPFPPRRAPTSSRFAVFAAALVRSETGVSAMEFAIVFPLFFLIFYAIVTYSLIFAAQQTLTLTAEEGARAALRYQKGATTVQQALTLRTNASCATTAGLKNWLGSTSSCVATFAPCNYDTTMQCVSVLVTYDYHTYPLVPSLPLLSSALPAQLSARAVVQLNPNTLL